MSRGLTLVTGFPSNQLATYLLDALLKREPEEQFLCVVPERSAERASAWLSQRSRADRERVELLEGDVAQMDLGLSGREFLELAARVRVIHHAAAVTYTGADRSLAERVNVQGTSEVLELATAASSNLERLVHWSSTAATSTRHGHVFEDDLIEPRSGVIPRSRFRAECLMRAARSRVPITVLRPAMLAGDSQTGASARMEGAYLLITGLLSSPRDVSMPLPARADALVNMVPIDYAVHAGLTLCQTPEALARTLHIVDPAPPTLEQALRLLASLLGRPTPHRHVPRPLARALLSLPGLERLTHAHGALVEEIGRSAHYDDRIARPLLERSGVSCPAFASYAPRMVEFVRRQRGTSSSRPPAPPKTPEPPGERDKALEGEPLAGAAARDANTVAMSSFPRQPPAQPAQPPVTRSEDGPRDGADKKEATVATSRPTSSH